MNIFPVAGDMAFALVKFSRNRAGLTAGQIQLRNPRPCMEVASLSDRREQDRINSEIERISKSSDPFAAAVRATRMPMLITDPNKPDNPIVFSNDAFSRLTGYAREEVLGRNCRFLQGAQTDPEGIAKIRDAMKVVVADPKVIAVFQKTGGNVMNLSPEDTEALVKRDVERWTKLLHEAGVSLD